jgi:hypothetical protein
LGHFGIESKSAQPPQRGLALGQACQKIHCFGGQGAMEILGQEHKTVAQGSDGPCRQTHSQPLQGGLTQRQGRGLKRQLEQEGSILGLPLMAEQRQQAGFLPPRPNPKPSQLICHPGILEAAKHLGPGQVLVGGDQPSASQQRVQPNRLDGASQTKQFPSQALPEPIHPCRHTDRQQPLSPWAIDPRGQSCQEIRFQGQCSALEGPKPGVNRQGLPPECLKLLPAFVAANVSQIGLAAGMGGAGDRQAWHEKI